MTIGSPFAVGVYEVTFAEWDACVGAGGCGGYIARMTTALGSWSPAGGGCELGGCAAVRTVVIPGDGGELPVVERSGVGVCGACGDADSAVLGER